MLRLIESDCTQLCKYIHIRCEVRTPSVRKERCELRQVSMLPAIFLLCDITIVFSQLNNCLPKRFLCEKRSRQTLSYGRLSPRETLLSLSLVNSQCPHLPSSGTGWAGERVFGCKHELCVVHGGCRLGTLDALGRRAPNQLDPS